MVKQLTLILEGKPYDVKWEGETILVNGQPFAVRLEGKTAHVGDTPYMVELEEGRAIVNGIAYPFTVERPGEVRVKPARKEVEGAGAVRAIMPGKVISILVEEGQEVQEGQVVCILEAMKMENELRAPCSGHVKEICVAPGNDVEIEEALVVIE
ncbi:MAG: biotin/lipoyl-containing protein [Anaerolineae bacterium]